MRKQIITVALFAVLCSMAVSCQKESIEMSDIALSSSEALGQYKICYTVDGVTHRITLRGEAEHLDFVDWMVGMAEQGHEVSFYDESRVSQNLGSKDVVIFTTSDKSEADNWAIQMSNNGYNVHISYNPSTGIYTCVARN